MRQCNGIRCKFFETFVEILTLFGVQSDHVMSSWVGIYLVRGIAGRKIHLQSGTIVDNEINSPA